MTQAFWGGKLLGGYAGLKHTAKKISEFIPSSKLYVEPFCGLASVSKYVKADKIILNDLSDFIIDYHKSQNYQSKIDFFVDADANSVVVEITKEDFEICIKRHDSSETFFLIDPVWRTEHYSEHTQAFMDRKPSEYYRKIFELVKTMKANWIICGVADERQTGGFMSNHNYYKKIAESDELVIFGKKARTLLVSNREFVNEKR